MTPLVLPSQTRFGYISRTLHTPMMFREMQVYGTIPQLSSVFAKTCNSNIFLYDQIINPLFFSLQWFSTSSWTFSNVSYFFLIKLIYTYIHSNLRSKYMKLKYPPHTATLNGLYTSVMYNVQWVSHPFFFDQQREF